MSNNFFHAQNRKREGIPVINYIPVYTIEDIFAMAKNPIENGEYLLMNDIKGPLTANIVGGNIPYTFNGNGKTLHLHPIFTLNAAGNKYTIKYMSIDFGTESNIKGINFLNIPSSIGFKSLCDCSIISNQEALELDPPILEYTKNTMLWNTGNRPLTIKRCILAGYISEYRNSLIRIRGLLNIDQLLLNNNNLIQTSILQDLGSTVKGMLVQNTSIKYNVQGPSDGALISRQAGLSTKTTIEGLILKNVDISCTGAGANVNKDIDNPLEFSNASVFIDAASTYLPIISEHVAPINSLNGPTTLEGFDKNVWSIDENGISSLQLKQNI